jgi:DNA uptake protein ComE-like DNA-binding protein
MSKTIIAAAIAGVALTLSGCSGGEENAGGATVEGAASETGAATTEAGTPAATADSGAALNANTATSEQLTGAELAPAVSEAIVAGRPYASVVALNAELRKTLSAEAASAVLEKVFVPVNLNSASREEIKLIPGMTDRMVGEFLEYRPYADLNEFDREIGKYVDEAEVARFRRYVTL